MELNAFSDIKLKIMGPFGKKLFAIYGANDKIRDIYLDPLYDDFYKNFAGVNGVLYLDDHMPDETKRLWNDPQSLEVSNYLEDIWTQGFWDGKGDSFTISEKDKKPIKKYQPNFTYSNSEFYALGTTNLKASTYGTITKQEDSKGNITFSVNIVVRMQYRDAFYDVLNVNPFSSASQNKNPKEMVGGKAFGFETRIRVIKINETMTNLQDLNIEIEKKMKEGN